MRPFGLLVALLAAVAALSLAARLPAGTQRRLNCSPHPALAAEYVIDANHLTAKVLRVRRRHFLPGSKLDPRTNRLYLVTFRLLKPNPVLGPGQHKLFSYVAWIPAAGAWCYRHGGTGP